MRRTVLAAVAVCGLIGLTGCSTKQGTTTAASAAGSAIGAVAATGADAAGSSTTATSSAPTPAPPTGAPPTGAPPTGAAPAITASTTAVLASPTIASSAAASPAAGSRAVASPSAAGVGQTVPFDDPSEQGTITLNGVRWMTTAEGPAAGFMDVPQNGAYLVADITVTSAGGDTTADSFAFSVIAPDGTAYDAALGVVDQDISSSELAPGHQVRGEVAFDVPRSRPYLLDYAITGPPLATFDIPAS